MARRRKRKSDNSLSSLLVSIIVLGLLMAIIFPLLSHYGFGLFLLAFVGLPAFYVFLKVYPRWAQMNRFRCLRLDDVDNMPGRAFEHYVSRLMEHQGFKTTVTKGSGDLGVDITAHKNGVSYAVQCKRYKDNISRTAISDAVAGKQHYGCQEAMVVTNRYFTSGAKELARSTRCVLIDRDTLAVWIQSFQRQTASDRELQRADQ